MTSDVILNFHGIGEPAHPLEDGEAPYWISIAQFHDAIAAIKEAMAQPSGRAIRITFDDGNASDLEIGAPALADAGLTAEFFILSGRLKSAGSLNAAGVRALRDMGMGVGVHGADHVDWRTLDDAGAERELIWARDRLAEVVGTDVRTAAIPFGGYNAGVLKRLKAAGYKRAYTSDGGPTAPDAWLQPRTSIRGDMTRADVAAILTGETAFPKKLRRGLAMFVKRHV